ncbi:7886_t:CDS:2, partial [Entrophospora sp. SA101]
EKAEKCDVELFNYLKTKEEELTKEVEDRWKDAVQILKLLKNLKGDSEDGLHGRDVGPLPPFPFGVSNVRIAEEDFWGREIIINYSVIIKTYIGMKKEDMERVKLFYDTTKGTQYLEKAVKYVIKVKDDESETLTLYLTPVGVNRKPDSVGKLHIAMYCIVHCVYNVHQRGWCIVELCWPNVVEQNDCFYVIDAGEFAQHHGKAIHGNMLCIFDPVTVDS